MDKKKNLRLLCGSNLKRLSETRKVATLLDIMAKLRGSRGCPWDRKQTADTLKAFLIEEAYEALEAIESGTSEDLKEELGDLLLHIVFLSRISEERGDFNFADVVEALVEKLIRRHPHVFPPPDGGKSVLRPKKAEEVANIWGNVKEREGKYAKRNSLLDDLPLALPALERARRISGRVSRVGFDWPNIGAVWEKVEEELTELKEATRSGSRNAAENELGDLLFTLVNWARFKGISAEEALRKANRRFAKRFRQVELSLRRKGKTPGDSTLEEMDHLWKESKKNERKHQRPKRVCPKKE